MQPTQPPLDPLDELSATDLKALAIAACAVGAVAGLTWLWRWDKRRRLRAARTAAVTRCGFEHLQDVLVPDGQGGVLHVDFLLLTARGAVVVDLRDVAGNIFGGDQMTEWTVMQRAHRHTFTNPQTGLYDRVAAVRALAHEMPVEGRVVFTNRGQFPKGLPRHAVLLDSLGVEFPAGDRMAMNAVLEPWLPGWDQIKAAVTPSRLADPKPAI